MPARPGSTSPLQLCPGVTGTSLPRKGWRAWGGLGAWSCPPLRKSRLHEVPSTPCFRTLRPPKQITGFQEPHHVHGRDSWTGRSSRRGACSRGGAVGSLACFFGPARSPADSRRRDVIPRAADWGDETGKPAETAAAAGGGGETSLAVTGAVPLCLGLAVAVHPVPGSGWGRFASVSWSGWGWGWGWLGLCLGAACGRDAGCPPSPRDIACRHRSRRRRTARSSASTAAKAPAAAAGTSL